MCTIGLIAVRLKYSTEAIYKRCQFWRAYETTANQRLGQIPVEQLPKTNLH